MNSKLSLLAGAAAITGLLALSLPALAQTGQPPAAPAPGTAAAKPGAVEHKTEVKKKKTVAKKEAKSKQMAEKTAVKKPADAAPATTNGTK